MRPDVASILRKMWDATLGRTYQPLVDFRAVQTTPTNVDVLWLNLTVPMPSAAEIDAAALTVDAAHATRVAQASKAAATASVDNGELQVGTAFERQLTGFVLVLLDELNVLRAAIPHPIVSITRVTTVATVTTPTAHGLIVGDPIAIAGAAVVGYNLTTTVATVSNGTTFTYTMANAGTTPAAGTLSYTRGAVPQLAPRTAAQVKPAIKAKIAATAE